MDKTVAVEAGLQNVSKYLQNEGFNVVKLDKKGLSHADMVVLTGGDKDFLGMEDVKTLRPVIDATGLSPEEVLKQINNYQ